MHSLSSNDYEIQHTPHTLYDVPVCQQWISPLSQFAERGTINHEAVGLTPKCKYLTSLHSTLKKPNPAVAKKRTL